MRAFRNIVFLVLALFLLGVNVQLFLNIVHPAGIYLIALDVIVSLIIVIDVIYGFELNARLARQARENDRLRLALYDHALESRLLSTLSGIMETYRGGMTFEEVMRKITESVKNVFKQETVLLQLIGENLGRVVSGRNIDIPSSVLEEMVLKGHPVLINNTKSFSQYGIFSAQGVTSFLVAPLQKKRELIGLLGVFAFEERQFTLRDLELLRLVTAPTSLLIDNAELFERTKVLSITDGLTHLYNRGHFETVLGAMVDSAGEQGEDLGLCMCDVDHFKFYNDTHGHPAGDRVLKGIADILKRGVKGSDVVARYGGEEFVIIFPRTSKENAARICELLRRTVAETRFPYEEDQPNGDLTISFGVAALPGDAAEAEDLLKKADDALYKAKEMGRNRVVTA